jgi:hypothetical protein
MNDVIWIHLAQNTEKFLQNNLHLKQKLSNYSQDRAVSYYYYYYYYY